MLILIFISIHGRDENGKFSHMHPLHKDVSQVSSKINFYRPSKAVSETCSVKI